MRENPWAAVRRGTSMEERKQAVARAHELLLDVAAGDSLPALAAASRLDRGFGPAPMRKIVLDSWARSITRLDPDRLPDQRLPDESALRRMRAEHPLERLLPVLRRLLIEDAEDAGLLVAVGDRSGRLLWVEGDTALRAAAERMGFTTGADWSEAAVGTSAPGTALALDHAVQVMGAEHFNRNVHRWSCTAAPVHDPATGELLGVIDITGGDDAVAPQTLPLIEAAVTVLETELRLQMLRNALDERQPLAQAAASTARPSAQPAAAAAQSSTARTPAASSSAHSARRPRTLPAPTTPAQAPAQLRVLGAGPHRLVSESAPDSPALTMRHAEILCVLAWHTQGLGSRRLAELVYGDAQAEGTLRAELVRLRHQLALHSGSSPWQAAVLELRSKPYRLSRPIEVDAARVLELVRRGAHRQALDAATGEVLPDSCAPGIEEIRAEVAGALREGILSSGSVDALDAYAMSEHGRHDAEVWWALLRELPPRSPKRAHVVSRLEQLADPPRGKRLLDH